MPIEIEFASVVVRKEAFDALGHAADQVIRPIPNWLEDDHLIRVGFMSTRMGSNATPSQRARGSEMMRDMARTFRGQDPATGK